MTTKELYEKLGEALKLHPNIANVDVTINLNDDYDEHILESMEYDDDGATVYDYN